jgi:hypothetical protein
MLAVSEELRWTMVDEEVKKILINIANR